MHSWTRRASVWRSFRPCRRRWSGTWPTRWAVLRRYRPAPGRKLLQADGLTVDTEEHTVTADGERIVLTLKEFELLRLFLSHPGVAFTRDRLFSDIWGDSYMGQSRTVDMHIRTLRQKLGRCGESIETVRGVGYRWEVLK